MFRKFACIVLFCFVWIPIALAQPAIVLQPEEIDFGGVVIGTLTHEAILVINTGDQTLIGDAVVSGDGFFLMGESHFEVVPMTDPRDTIAVIMVGFEPTAIADYSGQVTVTCNDPNANQIVVPLTGSGIDEPPAFSLLQPADYEVISLPWTFEWEALDVGMDVEYVLYVNGDSGIVEDPIFVFNAGSGTSFTIPPGSLLENGMYSWWVEARWEEGVQHSQQTWRFTLNDVPPAVFHLISPQDGAVITSETIYFEWEMVRDALYYRVIISPENAPADSPFVFTTERINTLTLNSSELDNHSNYRWRVIAFNGNDMPSADEWTFSLSLDGIPQSVSNLTNGTIPNEFRIEAVYPNPFNPQTEIWLSVPQAGFVQADIFDILGRKIASLVSGDLSAGYHRMSWHPDGPAGIYLLNVRHASGATDVKKLLFVK